MTIQIEITESVARAIRLPLENLEGQLKTELAVGLYARGALPFGKASELAGLTKVEFGLLLDKRNIPRQYSESDMEEDGLYAIYE